MILEVRVVRRTIRDGIVLAGLGGRLLWGGIGIMQDCRAVCLFHSGFGTWYFEAQLAVIFHSNDGEARFSVPVMATIEPSACSNSSVCRFDGYYVSLHKSSSRDGARWRQTAQAKRPREPFSWNPGLQCNRTTAIPKIMVSRMTSLTQ